MLISFFPQDTKLLHLVKDYGEQAWNRISKILGRSEIKCHKRFLALSNRSHMANLPWTKTEDEILTIRVTKYGASKWTFISQGLPGRIGKQCRERWFMTLSPDVIKRKWTIEEDLKILKLHKKCGGKWNLMARSFKGRTDNNIKNRYNSSLKKRMAKDPLFFM